MSSAAARIAILGIHLESNAFAPVTTGEDFRASCYFKGAAMLAEAAKPAPAMPAEIRRYSKSMPRGSRHRCSSAFRGKPCPARCGQWIPRRAGPLRA